MDWIKKNYDQGLLALLAFALIGVSVLLFLNTQSFGEKFADAMAAPTKNKKIPELNTGVIESVRRQLDAPKLWTSTNHKGLLFSSRKYVVKNNALELWEGGAQWIDSVTGELVPNEKLTEHGLPEVDPTVLGQDPDGDGFLNEDELRAGADTDPNKKESHPPYVTKLWLARWIKVPFRTKFQAYDGDMKTPEKMEFQINPVDAGGRTEFVKIGDTIAGTKFKVIKFEFKEKLNPSTGEKEDVSELTVINSETGESVALILNKIVDSPNQFAEFEYRWNKPIPDKGQTIRVPKLKEFVLLPETDQKYKLLDVNEAEAVIETPKGEKVSVKPYPTKK